MTTEQNDLEIKIGKAFSDLYEMLVRCEKIEAEECLGMVAEAQAIWLNEDK